MKVEKQEILESINERFRVVDIKTVDSKNRINLSEKVVKLTSQKSKVEAYKVFVGEKGDILLRPVVVIPSNEAWLYKNKEALKLVRQGLAEAAAGELERVDDLDEFFKNI